MATMPQKRYWLTLHNYQAKGVIRYREERKDIKRGETVEWQILIHIDFLDPSHFPSSEDLVGQSYWEYGARVQEAKELVARNILLNLKVPEKDIK